MTDSGPSGYFVQGRVLVNLDGLISSHECFVHLQNAAADEYLESTGLDYVFGNAYILQRSNPYQWNFDDRVEEFRYFKGNRSGGYRDPKGLAPENTVILSAKTLRV